MTTRRPLGILAPLAEEVTALSAEMAADGHARVERVAGRDVHVGRLWGRDCALTLSRVGKVAAATAAAALIHRFGVGEILVIGVAGGVAHGVKVGDVVVAAALLQHDMDASPIFPRHEVPLTGMSRFPADPGLARRLQAACAAMLAEDFPALPPEVRARFGLERPRIHTGLILSGDRFVSAHAEVAALRAELPDALALEMEGAAVAQVCHDHGIGCGVVRTISDGADDSAHVDFPAFLTQVASHYSHDIVRRLLGAAE